MGVKSYIEFVEGASAEEAFKTRFLELVEEYGPGSTNGTMSTCELVIDKEIPVLADTYTDDVRDAAITHAQNEQWGNVRGAHPIDLGAIENAREHMFAFYGLAKF